MGAITGDQVEWAVVDRMRQMLEEAERTEFTVTQSYALFCTTLCWVMQRVRVRDDEARSRADRLARQVRETLERMPVADDPWFLPVGAAAQVGRLHYGAVAVPVPKGFEQHTAFRLLKNLRDATAHGDARNVKPFNVGELLVGFTFHCAEFDDGLRQPPTWRGQITLLRDDMQRIGISLSRIYCGALSQRKDAADEAYFRARASDMQERAA